MKILVAVDGSECSRRALDWFVSSPLARDAQLTLVNVVAALPPRAAAFLQPQAIQAHVDDESAAALGSARERLDAAGMKADERVRVGHAADEIAAEAEGGGYGLLVMGTHGHGAVGNLVLGSVSSKVLARCGVPVLLVR